METRILIAGYYGYGNAGDELILACMLSGFRDQHPDLRFTVLSGNPAHTQTRHKVEAIAWDDFPGIIETVRTSDLCILGGGGLIQDYWGMSEEQLLVPANTGLGRYLNVPFLANLFGKPVVWYALGIGPLFTDEARACVRLAASLCDEISVRDEGSAKELGRLFADDPASTPRVTVSADPVFLYESPSNRSKALESIHQGLDHQRSVLGVSLRYWDFGADPDMYTQEIAAALDQYVQREKAQVLFIPFQSKTGLLYEDDASIHRRVVDHMSAQDSVCMVEFDLLPDDIPQLIQLSDLFLGMRYHGLLLAMLMHKPALGLAYDPKVETLFEEADHAQLVLPISNWRTDDIYSRLIAAPEIFSVEKMERFLRTKRELAERDILRVARIASGESEKKEVSPEVLSIFLQRLNVSSEKQKASENELRHSQEMEQQRDFIEQNMEQIENQRKAQEALIAELEAALADHREAMQTMSDAKRTEIEAGEVLSREKRDLEIEREGLVNRLERMEGELAGIRRTRGFGLLAAYWRVANSLLPPGSKRRRYSRRLLQAQGWFRNLPLLRQMSPYAFVYDIFKREQRKRLSYKNINSIRWPTKRGLVTVILPVYNDASYLREALDSVVNQTYQNWELIAINDGSTDDSGVILDTYAEDDERIQVIHQENRKLPISLTRGFNLARGEFLTWLSSDNQFSHDFMEQMVDCLDRHANWDLVYANMDIIDDSGNPLVDSHWYAGYQVPPGSEHIHLPSDTSELNIVSNNYIGAAFLYRDRVAGLIGRYCESRFTLEDYDYWMVVNALMTLRHVDFSRPVYKYRFHPNSLTSRDDELGITRDRTKLMIFEDFRRDFYLSPLAWRVENTPSDAAMELAQSITQHVSASGHYWMQDGAGRESAANGLWFPSVYISITDNLNREPMIPDDVPASMLKVLVSVADVSNIYSDDVSADWDLCVCTHDLEDPPALALPWQGWVAITNLESIFTAVDVRTRTHHLNFIEDEIARTTDPVVKISVIICTYQAGERLIACLESVRGQKFNSEDFEIIVVNNNPKDTSIHQLITDFIPQDSVNDDGRLRLLQCPFLGLSHARNIGIGEARGEVICFMDDDAIADSNWLQRIWEAFEEHPMAGVIGGPIILQQSDPKPVWMKSEWKRYWSHLNPDYSSYTEVEHWGDFPWGANWCARRRALLEIGGFRTKYGRRGLDYAGGEEVIAASLIQKLGYKIAFEPHAKVHHVVAQDRFTRKHIWNTILKVRRTWFQAYRDQYYSREGRLPKTYRRMISSMKKGSLFITAAEINAELHLLAWSLNDWLQRFRQPLTRK